MKTAEVTVTNEYSLASWGRKSTELKQTRECAHTNNNNWWAKREPAAVDTAVISGGQGMLDEVLLRVLLYQGRRAPRICLNLLLSTSSFFLPWSHQYLNRNLTLKMSKTWLLISALPPSNTRPSFPLPHTDSWDQTTTRWIARASTLSM